MHTLSIQLLYANMQQASSICVDITKLGRGERLQSVRDALKCPPPIPPGQHEWCPTSAGLAGMCNLHPNEVSERSSDMMHHILPKCLARLCDE
jgi:hypothetical protein